MRFARFNVFFRNAVYLTNNNRFRVADWTVFELAKMKLGYLAWRNQVGDEWTVTRPADEPE